VGSGVLVFYEDKIKNWLKDLGFDSINELALES